jgi:O-antigen/teichoic acid export membrane protein
VNINARLLKGSIMNTTVLFAQVIVSFVITPVLVHSLGDRAYGIWILVLSLIGYYSIFDLGISSSVARFVSRAAGKNEEMQIQSTINTALVLYAFIGAGALAVTVVLALFAGRFASTPSEISAVRACILIVGSLVAAGFPVRVFQGVLKAFLRYDLVAVAGLAKLFTANILIWIFIRGGHGIAALAAITALAGALEVLLTIFFAKRAFPALKLGTRFFRRETRIEVFSYSWRVFIIAITQQIKFKIDSLVIAGLLAVELVTHYSIGARFMDYFIDLVGNLVGGQLLPVFSRYDGRGDHARMRERFLNATRVSTLVSTFTGGSLAFYGGAFIERWMGPHFGSSYNVLLILVAPFTISLAQTPSVGFLYGTSKHHHIAWINSGAAVVNLTLSILLARTFGMYGVALGTAIELTITYLFVFPTVTCWVAGIPAQRYFCDAVGLTMLKTLLPMAVYFFVVSRFLAPSYPRLFALGILQAVVFAPVAFYFVLGKTERELLLHAFRPSRTKPPDSVAIP